MCQFDHFFNKSENPLFYVSFFNLIPVCSTCNHIKNTTDVQYSPHDIDFSVNDLTNFSIKLKKANISSLENIEIMISCQNNIIEENIKVLKLQDLYQIHTDTVSELYKKSQFYNDTFFDMLYKSYSNLFKSKMEIKQLLIGTYIDEKEYHKRPLSKLVNDISKSFGII